MDVKDLIDNTIRDLTEDAPISGIMLKAQAISSFLGNKNFATRNGGTGTCFTEKLS